MIEVVKKEEKVATITVEEAERYRSSRIIISESASNPSCQSILLQDASYAYFWSSFYLRDSYIRTRYGSFKEAIESRYGKGYRVFFLDNKTELKEFIKAKR